MSEHAERQHWRGTSSALRLRYIAQELSVPHPGLVSVIGELRRSAKQCKIMGEGDSMLVLAGSGCGKSHLIKQVHNLRPADHSGDVSVLPVVSFSIPPVIVPNQRSMSSGLLRSLEDPKWNRGTTQDMIVRGLELLKTAKTEIILIDNVQDIPERRSNEGITAVGNWIRHVIDESKCLVAMFGTYAAIKITDNDQMKRRATKRMSIRYFEFNSPTSKGNFQRFLRELDKRLPLAEASRLDELEVVSRLFWATNGIADYIFRLVREAVYVAVESGRERIELRDLEQAFLNEFKDSALGINPFTPDGPLRPLDQPGEPFHNWFDRSNPNPDKPLKR